MLQSGAVLNNRYEIIKVIGKGGMSVVYQARDQRTHRLLAIKDVERTGKNDNQVVEQSLAGEGRMLKNLSNPHLPRIYDIIENPENFMLVMDFIQGESLDKVIAREGAQPMARVLDWGMQICEVLDYLHSQPTPIIYRDMKPANVILQPDGKLMLIDFGTARTQKVGVAMQADTICIGTAGFAAPEQFGGIGQSTAKTDIFCLGATLYNMITGHSLCDRPVGILPLEQWNPTLAGTPISEIIYKCTRNDPNERYQTAMELREDLYRASNGTYGRGRHLSGVLRRNEWQRQDVRNLGLITNGLSGLIQRARPEQDQKPKEPKSAELQQPPKTVTSSGWQQSPPSAVVPQQPQPEMPVPEGGGLTWHKLMLVGLILAVVFLVCGVVLALCSQLLAAGVFLIFALGGAALAIVSMVLERRDNGSAQ